MTNSVMAFIACLLFLLPNSLSHQPNEGDPVCPDEYLEEIAGVFLYSTVQCVGDVTSCTPVSTYVIYGYLMPLGFDELGCNAICDCATNEIPFIEFDDSPSAAESWERPTTDVEFAEYCKKMATKKIVVDKNAPIKPCPTLPGSYLELQYHRKVHWEHEGQYYYFYVIKMQRIVDGRPIWKSPARIAVQLDGKPEEFGDGHGPAAKFKDGKVQFEGIDFTIATMKEDK